MSMRFVGERDMLLSKDNSERNFHPLCGVGKACAAQGIKKNFLFEEAWMGRC